MDFLRLALSKTRSCAQNEKMIIPNSRIAVGLSGGKDSVSLLYTLKKLSEFYPVPFSVCAITVDNGFANSDFSKMEAFCHGLGIEYKIVKTNISEIADNNDDPCAVCAKMRRRILCDTAIAMGCNTLALAHTQDDAAQTVLLNLLYNGKFETFLPVTEYEQIRVIRPFFTLEEKTCTSLIQSLDLPVCKSLCPYDKKTQRQTIRDMIEQTDRICRGTSHRIINAYNKSNKNTPFGEQ